VQGGTPLADSGYPGAISEAVRKAGSERVVTIDIGTTWWSTRLYLLAFLLDRLTGARRILVLDSGEFVGLLPLTTIIRVIASLHRQIETFEQTARVRTSYEADVSLEAEALVELFKASFVPTPTAGIPAQPAEIANVGLPAPILSEESATVDVTRANLVRWFQESIITSPIRVDNIKRASPLDLIRLFDYPGDFVPIIVRQGDNETIVGQGDNETIVGQGDNETKKPRVYVIDKPALSLQLAQTYVTNLLDEARL